ncbi:MAG TPA: ABC transporter permease [Thermoanaerobaculia bacterium]|nr:ABC transporter permease [Thermoanaerobaculia bacterium]
MREFLENHGAEILRMTAEHLAIVVVAVIIATTIAIPAGILCARRSRWGGLFLRVADAVQTIPSLALFGFLIPLPFIGGIGTRTALVALVLYSLLPILRNTVIGIREVDPVVREVAVALGMEPRQILRQVELPLAAPVILGGIRLAVVIGIGVATIGAAVGGGGLGTLIFRGVAMVDSRLILAGAIPAALLALIADFGLSAIERKLSIRSGDAARKED